MSNITAFSHCLLIASALSAISLPPARAQTSPATETVLHNFGGLRGANPYAGIIADAAGNFYGTTSAGGTAGLGVIFKLDTARQETVLYNFTGGADGAVPYASVIFDAAGNLYGTTYQGGAANVGVVYELDAGGQETVLYSFLGGTDGANPKAGLIFDADGNLYGTTSAGGSANAGTVFKIDAAHHETVLYTFTGGADGCTPLAGLVLDPAGNLYGTTLNGGNQRAAFGDGVVFKLDAAGRETVLHWFSGKNDGGWPGAGLALDPGGNLFGTTQLGGVDGGGVVFRLDATGHENVIYDFPGSFGSADSGVILDSSGNLYGTYSDLNNYGYGFVFKLDPASHLVSRFDFTGGANGSNPYSGVIRDAAGNLYGTTIYGGAHQDFGNGIVYKWDTTGKETVLCSFTDATDGIDPSGGVIRDEAGNLFGTATFGGGSDQGVIFKIAANGVYSVLHRFTGGNGGGQPYYGVIRDAAGNLYGTAGAPLKPGGVVFKLDAAGTYTVLHRFTGTGEIYPSSGVIRDSAGNLYGTTGGDRNCIGSSVYKLDAAGNYTVLYGFTGASDGCYPFGGVVRDAEGNLYGTTDSGGMGEAGTLFEVDVSGQETVLYSFTESVPSTGIVRDSAGNFYGVAGYYLYELDAAGTFMELYNLPFEAGCNCGVVRDAGGNLYGTGGNGSGSVYELDATGNFTILHYFTGGADGDFPSSGLTLDPAGNLYGTTTAGGNGGNGVVFKIELATPSN